MPKTTAVLRALALVGGLAGTLGLATGAHAAGEYETPPNQDWSWEGPFGTYDRASAQRGFLVYKQVCASCHSMDLLDYRHLTGIGFSEAEVSALASGFLVIDGPDENGDMFRRPAVPSDGFINPYENDQMARLANNGSLPPDLSVITKARAYGADYLYALLTGYEDPPEGVELRSGMHYNRYFSGGQIAMPSMIVEGGGGVVEYLDGTEPTLAQQAWDVTTFMMWAAEPHMERRKEMGVMVLLFLAVFAVLMWMVKRRVWSDTH